MRYVKSAAKDAGIGLKDVKVVIDRDPDLIGRSLYGHAVDNKITLYPDAFTDYESLVKTIGHERTHIFQFKLYGLPQDSKIGEEFFEVEAKESEDIFWQFFKLNR